MISLNQPLKPDIKKLTKLLERVNDSGWYTNFGPLQEELKQRLEDYLNVRNLLLVNNGTSALQVAGKAIKSKNILTTPYSFAATASAFLWQKDAVSFVDIDPKSLNLCPSNVERMLEMDSAIDTVVATHVYGNPCAVESFEDIGNRYNLKVIYDAAHAFGVFKGKKSILSYGNASTVSFHATKLFHTVEGGGIVFRSSDDYEQAKKLINFGLETGQVASIGINAKLNEYQAAVGLINLENIKHVIEHRAELFELYKNKLENVVSIPEWAQDVTYNGAYFAIKLASKEQRSKVASFLAEKGIESREYFSTSLESLINNNDVGCPNSQLASNTHLCLPLHFYMNKQDVEIVCQNIKKALVL